MGWFSHRGSAQHFGQHKVPVERDTPKLGDLDAEISILVDDKGQIVQRR